METSIVKRNVLGYALYYLDAPKIMTEEASTPATIMATEGPFEIAYIHRQAVIDRATQVILQITCDKIVNKVCIGRVIYVWTADITICPTTGEYQLINATKMDLASDLVVSNVHVAAIINGDSYTIPEYNIQLRSRFDGLNHIDTPKTTGSKKKITKILRK